MNDGSARATVTLGEAARLTGLGKTTIARAIKAGRLSATRTDLGSYSIDAAELHRVYPLPAPATGTTVDVTGEATPNTESQIAALREVADLLRAQLMDVKEDRDHWRQQATRLVLAPPAPVPAPVAPSRRWWRRRAG